MPRFYFHIRDTSGLIPDKTGADFNSLSEAHHEGIKLAKCMAGDLHDVGDAIDGQVIEVADADGNVLETVALRDFHPDL
jgi:hypothetical protein